MLVVQRKQNETIHIGENIIVEILETLPNGDVRVGIKAPSGIIITRGEQLINPASENLRAAQSDCSTIKLAAFLQEIK